ncbi:hypothetical protein FI667_g5009, partial [Globisporangium splendens]
MATCAQALVARFQDSRKVAVTPQCIVGSGAETPVEELVEFSGGGRICKHSNSSDEGSTDDDAFSHVETVVERESGGADGTMTASAGIEGAQVEGVDKDDEEAKEGSAFALDEVAVRRADAAILADDKDRQRRRSHSWRDIESRVMDYPTSLHYLRRLQQSSMIRDGLQTANARAFCSPTSTVGHSTSTRSASSASSLRTTPCTSSTSARRPAVPHTSTVSTPVTGARCRRR